MQPVGEPLAAGAALFSGILIRCYESEVTGQFPTTPFSLSDLSLIGEARAPSQVLRLVLCLIIFFW